MSDNKFIPNPLISAGGQFAAIGNMVEGMFTQTAESVTAIYNSQVAAAQKGMGEAPKLSLEQTILNLNTAQADALISSLIKLWLPESGKPSTVDMLAAQGAYTADSFAKHGAKIQAFWTDTNLRQLLIDRATLLGITITTNTQTGFPVFTKNGQKLIKDYTIENGYVKLK